MVKAEILVASVKWNFPDFIKRGLKRFGIIVLGLSLLVIGGLSFAFYQSFENQRSNLNKQLGNNQVEIQFNERQITFIPSENAYSNLVPFPFYPIFGTVDGKKVVINVSEEDVRRTEGKILKETQNLQVFSLSHDNDEVFYLKSPKDYLSEINSITYFDFLKKVLISTSFILIKPSVWVAAISEDNSMLLILLGVLYMCVLFYFMGTTSKQEVEQRNIIAHKINKTESGKLNLIEVEIFSINGRKGKELKLIKAALNEKFKIKKFNSIFQVPILPYSKMVGNPVMIVKGPSEYLGRIVPSDFNGNISGKKVKLIDQGEFLFVTKL